jgi:tRNA-dihydrouridine synthase
MSDVVKQLEKPYLLAGLALSSPTLMAPMQGVGASSIRDTIAQSGPPGMFCTPFLRVTAQRPNISLVKAHLHRTGRLPISAQVLGSHAEHLALAANVLADAGADVVDLNLGCPTRQAAKRGVGAALLSRLDSIARIVERMRSACRCRLSVKVRTSEGDPEAVVRVARVVEDAGADFLIVHPRTSLQGYEGLADWSVVRLLKSSLSIPVVGNGDLWYAGDALRLMRASGADAIMLGRPALRNPFIFRQIGELCAGLAPYTPGGADIVRHVETLALRARAELERRSRGPDGALKEQTQYLLRAVPEPLRSLVWQHAMHAIGTADILTAIARLRDAPQLDLAADGPLRLEAVPNNPG